MSATPPADESDNIATIRGFDPGHRVGSGRYTLKKLLGQGGMGIVWLAYDARLKEEVALKFLPSQIRADPTALDDLRQETLRSRKLTHTHIIRIHDLFEAPGEDAFISMEYVDGPTMSAVRVQQPGRVLAWDYLARLIKQLCEALEYAHGEKVIHRDLKPANLMLDSRGRIKLADFGIARVVTDSVSRITQRVSTSGTLVYMSPQQLDGKAAHITDDIYSLGATLYELVTSKPPFYTGEIAHQIRYVEPVTVSRRLADFGITNDLPPEVEETIAACLAKNPPQRPQRAREAAERLGLVEIKTPSSKARSRNKAGQISGDDTKSPSKKLTVLIWSKYFSLSITLCMAGGLLLLAAAWSFTGLLRKSQSATAARPPKKTEVVETPRTNAEEKTVLMSTQSQQNQPTQADEEKKRQEAEAKRLAEAKAEAQAKIEAQAKAEAQAKTEAEEKVRREAEQTRREAERVKRANQQRFPVTGQSWTNSLGMRFAPVKGTDVLFSAWETRVQDYKSFVTATNSPASGSQWQNPGLTNKLDVPVDSVSWDGAKAFCQWLTDKEQSEGKLRTHQKYRLPTDLEWSAAVGLGQEDGKTPKARSGKVRKIYPWGTVWPPPNGAGNYGVIRGYRDDYAKASPVGSFEANTNGLYDLGGNVWEWTQDWFDETKQTVVLRGASWNTSEQKELLSSFREDLGPRYRLSYVGFRCVLEVADSSTKP